ncbi:MAG: GntR family transcriptional regulator [Victivallales bacterium]
MSGIPVYGSLCTRIRKGIASGRLRPGGFIGTEMGMVRQYGISRVSVRRAFDQLEREGIVERAPGKGVFVRDSLAHPRIVQLVMPMTPSDFTIGIAKGAWTSAQEKNIHMSISDTRGSCLNMFKAPKSAISNKTLAGLILVSSHLPDQAMALRELKRNGMPVVVVDEDLTRIGIPSVLSDNYGGGYRVGKELVALGHRSIAFVPEGETDTGSKRFGGLRDAVIDAGLPFDRSLVIRHQDAPPGVSRLDWFAESFKGLRSKAKPPTAIFFSSSYSAAGGCRMMKGMGLKIPADVSVVAFDDSPFCEWLEPPLAVVNQPSEEIGRLAMTELLSASARPGGDVPKCLELPVEWKPRESIGPASGVRLKTVKTRKKCNR